MADWVTGRWGAMVASAFQRKRQIPGMHPAASSTTPFGRDDSGPSTEITDVSSAAKKEIFSGGGVFFFFFLKQNSLQRDKVQQGGGGIFESGHGWVLGILGWPWLSLENEWGVVAQPDSIWHTNAKISMKVPTSDESLHSNE
jgi:hypothetical protein